MGIIALASPHLRLIAGALLALGGWISPAAAQDKPVIEDRPATIFMVGVGPVLKPKYPGAEAANPP